MPEEKEIVETVYGKYHRYDIVKEITLLGSIRFWIRKDGQPYRGTYPSLKSAVDAAEKEG